MHRDKWLEKWWRAVEERRKNYGVRQDGFAVALGLSRVYYSSLVSGRNPTSKGMRKKVRKTLDRLNPENPLTFLIDYCRIRFPYTETPTIEKICDRLLNIPFKAFAPTGHGWNNYENCLAYGDIFLCTSPDEELGTLLEMRGAGCRQFEIYLEYNEKSWVDFFEGALAYGGVFKRMDLAVNDHYGILDIGYLAKKCQEGECIGFSRKYSLCESGELKFEKFAMGRTLYVGTRKSDIYFCIYEKDYEQYVINNIPIEEAATKNRFEIRLANERAAEAAAEMIEGRQLYDDWEEVVVFGIINYYIRFAVEDPQKKKKDWENDPMWDIFLGAYGRDKIRLAQDPQPFSEWRALNWLSHQCMPTMKALLARDVQCGTDYVVDMINEAVPSTKLQKVLDLEEQVVAELNVKRNGKGDVKICKKNQKGH